MFKIFYVFLYVSFISIIFRFHSHSYFDNKDQHRLENWPKGDEPEDEVTFRRKLLLRPLSLRAQRQKMEFSLQLHDVTVIEDKCARLICAVVGGHEFDIEWQKDGKKLRFKEDNVKILNYNRQTTGCIGIQLACAADAGTYTCTFTDKETKQTLSTSCQVNVVPRVRKIKEASKQTPPTFIRKLQCKY